MLSLRIPHSPSPSYPALLQKLTPHPFPMSPPSNTTLRRIQQPLPVQFTPAMLLLPSRLHLQSTSNQTSTNNPVIMCSQSARKSLQGGESKHGHRSHGHHGSSTGGGQSQATQWYYVWTCDYCWNSSGMSTHIVTHCPECNHQRCETCPTEPKKSR